MALIGTGLQCVFSGRFIPPRATCPPWGHRVVVLRVLLMCLMSYMRLHHARDLETADRGVTRGFIAEWCLRVNGHPDTDGKIKRQTSETHLIDVP